MDGLNLRIGTPVHFRDGRGGVLRKLVVDPHTHWVTDLVVEKGFLQKHDRVIPVSAVTFATSEEIYLAIHSQQLPYYPEYREIEFVEPVSGWDSDRKYPREQVLHWLPYYGLCPCTVVPVIRRHTRQGISGTQELIGRSTSVRSVHGVVGKIDHLWVDRHSWEITHLVVRRGFLPYHLVIPASWIEAVDEGGVYIRGTEAQLQELPRYRVRSTADILIELYHCLDTAPFDYSSVTVSLENGVLRLRGMVESLDAKHQAEEMARSIVGVIEVENLLDTHLDIAAWLPQALELEPRTAEAAIEVVYDRGVVTLSGTVESAAVRAAAEEVVVGQAGVISVVNALEVRHEQEVPQLEFNAIAMATWPLS